MNSWHIGEILIQKRLIDWKQLEEALHEQRRTREFVGELLVRKRYVPKYLLFKALAEKHAMAFVDLSRLYINPRAVERVPRSLAVKYGFVPIEFKDETLVLGVGDPRTMLPETEIAELAGVAGIETVLSTPEAVAEAIDQNYGAMDAQTGVAQ